ncbi:helix-turn-helix domain-containing protein [Kribbella sp. NBC_01245]|uniref:helix-turn-helix domain-containing protein n=1 Tax=Kribbella sp. NBC_01245 TaxID=2903578 RepID=UPI002E2D36F3|nr:helix-turn-helix domain-containing protein [Kribbella sp. NBC_01245]
MLITRLGPDDLATTRFTVSPLWETVTSRWAMQDPARHAVHLPWIRNARQIDRSADFQQYREVLDSLIRVGSWIPDFLTPPPDDGPPDFHAELTALAETPLDQMRADLAETQSRTPLQGLGRQFLEEPERYLPELVEALNAWWTLAIEPSWPQLRAVLEADIAERSRTLAEHGPARMFGELHPSLRWRDGVLEMENRCELDFASTATDAGLPMAPSVFLAGPPAFFVRPGEPLFMWYAIEVPATFWRGGPSPQLVQLMGDARARLLAVLDEPRTADEVASRLGLSMREVTADLLVLQEAGLLVSHNDSYARTELGRSLSNLS